MAAVLGDRFHATVSQQALMDKFLNVTESQQAFGDPLLVATELRDEFAAIASSRPQNFQSTEQERQQRAVSNNLQVISECDFFKNKRAFLITEFKEIILAQGKAIAELKGNSVAQDLVTEECERKIEALQAERESWKAQNASQNCLREEMQELRRDLKAACLHVTVEAHPSGSSRTSHTSHRR